MTDLLIGLALGLAVAGAAFACADEQLGAQFLLAAAVAGFAALITRRNHGL
jgi:hypothetical protein